MRKGNRMHPWACWTVMIAVIVCGGPYATAEMMPIKPGTVRTYHSDNGKYEVVVTFGEQGSGTWALKEDGRELWSEFTMPPDHVVVSDNGQTLLVPTWGWRDEMGSSGVAVYDGKGQLVREVKFESGNPPQETLKWVRVRGVSPDGKYFGIAENGNEQGARLTLFESATGKKLWEKNLGYPEAVEIKISPEARRVLFSTSEDEKQGMKFLLLDRSGETLWQKTMEANYENDVEQFSRFKEDGEGFEIFDRNAGSFISEAVK